MATRQWISDDKLKQKSRGRQQALRHLLQIERTGGHKAPLARGFGEGTIDMKSFLALLAITTALTFPGLAMARPVTLTTTLSNYGGDGAYLALYVTDAQGAYVGSLWMAGAKSKYYEHLSGWYRVTGGNVAEIDGITGASVGAGRTLEITLDLADALFDAGYTLHIDAAVEDMRDSPNEVAVPLTAAGAGTAVPGRRYVADFSYAM
jgi:hypothetical protein